MEIEAGNMRMYSGNYSAYALKKAQLRDAQYKAYLNQQRDIKHQEAVIAKLKSFNREKSIKRAESREKCWIKSSALINHRRFRIRCAFPGTKICQRK